MPVAPEGGQTKRELRRALAARRRLVPANDALAAGEAVARTLLGEARIRAAPRVGFYAAFDGELPTRPIFDALRGISVVRLFPRLRGHDLDWVRVDDWNRDLVPGKRGNLEPAGSVSETLTPRDVVLLPGLAFDCHGWRLGRGGGHYDRAFVGQVDRPWLVGVAYAFQCLLEVPHDSRDVRIDAVITENGWTFRSEE